MPLHDGPASTDSSQGIVPSLEATSLGNSCGPWLLGVPPNRNGKTGVIRHGAGEQPERPIERAE